MRVPTPESQASGVVFGSYDHCVSSCCADNYPKSAGGFRVQAVGGVGLGALGVRACGLGIKIEGAQARD